MQSRDIAESRRAIARAQANEDRLLKCGGHLFDVGNAPFNPQQRVTCQRCGGLMQILEAFRYAQGFKAAGGNPNDVIPGFE